MKKKVANRIIAECESINGSKIIFPSTFGETKDSDASKSKSKINDYRHNFVNLDKKTGRAEAVLVDSVGSFANRIETSLIENGILPCIKINIDGVEIDANTLPHRIYDAVMRDSLLNGIPWRQSELGKLLLSCDIRNATGLFEYAPLIPLFGGWDSMGGDAVTGTKIARSVACEIWGKDVQALVNTAHRINPFPSASESGDFVCGLKK